MSRTKAFVIVALLIGVVAVMSVNTYAAYSANVSSGTSAVAKIFDFKVNGNGSENVELGNVNLELGNSHEFALSLDPSGSEVDMDVTVDIALSGDQPVGLSVSMDGSELISSGSQTYHISAQGGSVNVPITVSWQATEEQLIEAYGHSAPDESITKEFNLGISATITSIQSDPNA